MADITTRYEIILEGAPTANLRRREGVFTPEQMRALAPVGSAAPQVTVEVIIP